MSLRAIGYCRISPSEQAESGRGVSLAAQESRVRAYAQLYGIELIDVILDAAESGKTLKRPGIQTALARLRAKEADGIIVPKLDRLSRSVGDWDELIAEYFGEKAKPSYLLWSVGEQIDTRTAGGRLVLNLLMSVAQWERETIGERTRAALQFKRSRGERLGGRVEYGFTVAPDGKTLLPCLAEQEVLATIRTMRAAGHTLQSIADELNARGIYRREGSKWEHRFLSRLLKRAA
jgi:DNA invertase Pin-like site-specific DNA recombinase